MHTRANKSWRRGEELLPRTRSFVPGLYRSLERARNTKKRLDTASLPWNRDGVDYAKVESGPFEARELASGRRPSFSAIGTWRIYMSPAGGRQAIPKRSDLRQIARGLVSM